MRNQVTKWKRYVVAVAAALLLTATGNAYAEDNPDDNLDINGDTSKTFTNNTKIIYLNSGGTLTANSLVTDSGTWNFNGGYVSVSDSGTGVTFSSPGRYNFNLDNYQANSDTPLIAGTITVERHGSTHPNAILYGGKDGVYTLIEHFESGYSPGEIFGYFLQFDDTVLTSYEIDGTWTTGDALKIRVTTNGDGIMNAALANSSSNGRVAAIIAELERQGGLPNDVNYSLRKVASGLNASAAARAVGRAITELNGTNSESANGQMAKSASHQFNAAMGQVFGDNFSANIARGNVASGGARFGGRSSAGGRPTGATGATGRGAGGLTGFAKVYGGFGSQGSTNAAAGYDFGGVGLLTGIGYKFASELEIGALFGYSYNHAELYQNFGENTDNILRLGAYGNFTWNNFYLNTAPTFGIHLIDSERAIDFMGVKAKSDRTGYDFSWYNRAGYTFELPANFYLTPSYALSMSYFQDPEHTEHGAGGANLHLKDYDNWSLLQNLEVRVGKLFQVNDCFALLPEIWGGWEHEYFTGNNATMAFATNRDNNWVAPVKDIAQDRATLGVGLTTIIKNKYEVNARYDERLWDGGHSSMFTVGVSVKF